MTKRGTSHLEIIFAFILFVLAVGFALYFFSPRSSDMLVDSSIDYAFREIIKNTSGPIYTYALTINNENNQIRTQNGEDILAIEIEDMPEVYGFKAIGLPGSNFTKIIMKRNSTNKKIYYLENETRTTWKNKDFLYLKFSENLTILEATETLYNNVKLNRSFYSIGSVNRDEIVFESRMIELKNAYETDTRGVNNAFNLPGRVNFGFYVIFADGSKIEAKRNISEKSEVFSKSRRIEILRTNGEIEFAELIVRVWQ